MVYLAAVFDMVYGRNMIEVIKAVYMNLYSTAFYLDVFTWRMKMTYLWTYDMSL